MRRQPETAELLAALRDAVDRSSFRAVADALGLSAAGVYKLLNGAVPRRETHQKLVTWYQAHCTATDRWQIQAFRCIVSELPVEAVRERTVDLMLLMLRYGHAECGHKCPAWLEAELNAGPGRPRRFSWLDVQSTSPTLLARESPGA